MLRFIRTPDTQKMTSSSTHQVGKVRFPSNLFLFDLYCFCSFKYSPLVNRITNCTFKYILLNLQGSTNAVDFIILYVCIRDGQQSLNSQSHVKYRIMNVTIVIYYTALLNAVECSVELHVPSQLPVNSVLGC